MANSITLANLNAGELADITGYEAGDSAYLAKLLALGLTHGTKVKITNIAPLGDPIEVSVRGYNLLLRRHEVSLVKVSRCESGVSA